MSKKNLPNIPIYIGDWERDCNVLSLESEAAWMRIVFKLWTKGKQNSIKIPTKSLQNLWRCSGEKVKEILDDLIFNEIAEIEVSSDFVEFTCRRYVKENSISEIRSNSSKGKKKTPKQETKDKQTLNKTSTKHQQNTENENENENVIEYKYKGENFKKEWDRYKKYRKATHKFKFYDSLSEQKALRELENLSSSEAEAIDLINRTISKGWKGFHKSDPEEKKRSDELPSIPFDINR